MPAPTVTVTVDLSTFTGEEVPDGTVVYAQLDKNEHYGGIIIAGRASATTTSGIASLEVFPNALQSADPPGLGTQGSTLRVWVEASGSRKKVDVLARIPNQDCDLHDVLVPDDDAEPEAMLLGAVRFDFAQSLTSPQQAQARANIGFDAAVDAAMDGAVLAATLAESTGSSLVGHIATGSGAAARTVQAKLRESLWAADYGAVGDGVTSDTTALQNAINAGYAQSKPVRLNGGTYLVNGLTFFGGTQLVGAGSSLTTIKLSNAANVDVLKSQNAYTYFGTNNSGGDNAFRIEGLTIDGNSTNQTSLTPDSCNGLAFYGAKPRLVDLIVKNTKGHGIRSEWYSFGDNSGGMEGFFSNVVIDNVGRHGWWFKGPHDSHFEGVIVIDASQEADNTYHGLYIASGNGRFINAHTWHRAAATNRMQYGAYSAGSNEFVACHFEGGRGQLKHAGTQDRVVGCNFYAHRGANESALVVFAGNDNQHVNCYYTAGNTDLHYAVEFSNNAGGNRIDSGIFNGFAMRGPFNFSADGGLNYIRGSGYSAAAGATSFGGSQSATTQVVYDQGGTSIVARPKQYFPAGTIAAPGLTLVGDTDTGVAQPGGANTLSVAVNGVESARFETTSASAVNYVKLRANITGSRPYILAGGSDTNIGLIYSTKGTEQHVFYTNTVTNIQMVIDHTASSANWLRVLGGAAGFGPTVTVDGEANANLNLAGKGTGMVMVPKLGTVSGDMVLMPNSGKLLMNSSTNYTTTGYAGSNCFYTTGTAGTGYIASNWANNTVSCPSFQMLKSKSGTVGTRGAVTTGDLVGTIQWGADDGTNFADASRIQVEVDSSVSTGIVPTRLRLLVSDTAGTLREGIRVTAATQTLYASGAAIATVTTNGVLVTAAAGLGYTTGAGGTATQATSKSTGVSVNKPSGQITLNAASLDAGATASFTLANSLISATDTVTVHRSSGGTAGAYDVSVDSVATGSCVIRVKNNTAGALAEAVVISFCVLKGAST